MKNLSDVQNKKIEFFTSFHVTREPLFKIWVHWHLNLSLNNKTLRFIAFDFFRNFVRPTDFRPRQFYFSKFCLFSTEIYFNVVNSLFFIYGIYFKSLYSKNQILIQKTFNKNHKNVHSPRVFTFYRFRPRQCFKRIFLPLFELGQ